MKTLKKIFALVLALTMVLAMATSASAVSPMSGADGNVLTGSVKINKAAAGTTYTFYRVFDLASTTGDAHVYITNDQWDTIRTAVASYATADNGSGNVVTMASDFTGDAKAQSFAAAVLGTSITKVEEKTVTTSGTSEEITGLQYGYYIMVSSRTVSAEQTYKYTVFTLASNSSTLTIEEKNEDLPIITKYVEEDDTETFGESNVAEIGQTVNFKVEITADAGTDTYTVIDDMTNFENVTLTSVVYSGGTITDSDYTFTTDTDGAGFTFTLNSDFRSKLNDGKTITITYTANLTTSATIAGNGNDNTVKLYYDGKATSGDTDKYDSTTTKTYALTVNKTDSVTGSKLADAGFKLYRVDNSVVKFSASATANTYVVDPKGTVEEIKTDSTGTFVINGLDTDTYTLKETTVPAGYTGATDKDVTITTGTNTADVTNTPGTTLPSTGGMGTTLFYTVGGVLVLGAIVLLVTKKRMG